MKPIFSKALICLFLSAPFMASATAMSEELSKCLAMQDIVKLHDGWKYDYFRFKARASEMDFDSVFELSSRGTKALVSRINEIKRLAGLENADPMLNEATELLESIKSGSISHRDALPVLSSGLEKLRDKMSFVISQAHHKTQCQLYPDPIGINPNGRVPPQ